MKLWVGDDDMEQKTQENNKDSVENENNRKKNCDYDAKFNSGLEK